MFEVYRLKGGNVGELGVEGAEVGDLVVVGLVCQLVSPALIIVEGG
jgi:hypothetical protein